MILTAVLTILYGAIRLILTPILILNDVVLDSNITTAFTKAGEYLANVNQVLPVSTILAVIGVFLGVEVFILLWKTINWLIRKIPTIN